MRHILHEVWWLKGYRYDLDLIWDLLESDLLESASLVTFLRISRPQPSGLWIHGATGTLHTLSDAKNSLPFHFYLLISYSAFRDSVSQLLKQFRFVLLLTPAPLAVLTTLLWCIVIICLWIGGHCLLLVCSCHSAWHFPTKIWKGRVITMFIL